MLFITRLFLAFLITIYICLTSAFSQDMTMEAKLAEAFKSGQLKGLHSVLILHKGEIFAESHFTGSDQHWGNPLGNREHGPKTLHDLRSVTKPIISLLYGIALAEGKVPDIDSDILSQFPDYADLKSDTQRKSILIQHALSMKMGTQWNEDLPYSDPKNSEIAMEYAKDRYRYVLDRPMVNKPGDQWTYNGGAVAIIAKLIADGVGMPVDQYAQQKLFQPLGITDYQWTKGADGIPSAASGLRLNIHDLAKIGQLILQKGKFGGQQIVPEAWLTQSFTAHSDLKTGLRYGYFWWLAPASWGNPPAWVAGFGNGGQRLTVQPARDLVIVVFAGNYNEPNAWQLPVKIIEKFLSPALRAKLKK